MVVMETIAQTRVTPTDEATHYYGYDGHGNLRLLLASNVVITDTYDYEGFGNLITRSGTTVNHLQYCGEYLDPDLGLYFLRARYMETGRGRFWTMDAIEGISDVPVSLHKYLYANGNPVTFTDPSGQFVPISALAEAAQIIGMLARMARPSWRAGECGKADVTSLVGTAIGEIRAAYNSWPLWVKAYRCFALYQPATAGTAWDIEDLFYAGASDWYWDGVAPGTKWCWRTVVYKGRCYRASSVNYIMWGEINALCFGTFFNMIFSLPSALHAVELRKMFHYEPFAQVHDAKQFTAHGYYRGGTTPWCYLANCDTSGSTSVPPSPWEWLDYP